MWSKLFVYEDYPNSDLAYHNADHVLSMYEFLELNRVPYDKALDLAILYHDIVYDEHSDKEFRSAQLLYDDRSRIESPEIIGRAIKMILATREHVAEDDEVKWIVKADLHQLTSRSLAIKNFSKILDESVYLYGVSEHDFAKANISFMRGLQARVHSNMMKHDTDDSAFWSSVNGGIYTTIELSTLLLGQ